MHKQVTLLAILALGCSISCLYGAYKIQSGFWYDMLMNSFGTTLSISGGLLIVNLFLDKKSRQIAAGPLIGLIQDTTALYHNELFIKLGRQTFGISEFNRLVEAYTAAQRNPQAFSPEERSRIYSMIISRREVLLQCISDLDSKLSDLMSVLGWSYDAEIIAAALICKKGISQFRIHEGTNSDEAQLGLIEAYLDIDASSSGVIRALAKIYNRDMYSAS